MVRLLRFATCVSVALAGLAFAASAFASSGSASLSAYGGQAGKTQGPLNSTAGGSLPFTGTNLAFVVAIGLLLVGFGFALRRRASRTD
jgi:LPXTG-motif cell wall-anchored protein